MRENEELFRLANERLREQVADVGSGDSELETFHVVRKEPA